jgi:hypothetical protein
MVSIARSGIPSCFLYRGRVRIGIPRVCFYFCSTEQNSELFSLPGKGLERNSESFLFRGTAGIPSEITFSSVYSVFRGIIFCRRFTTLIIVEFGCKDDPPSPGQAEEQTGQRHSSQMLLPVTCLNVAVKGTVS